MFLTVCGSIEISCGDRLRTRSVAADIHPMGIVREPTKGANYTEQ